MKIINIIFLVVLIVVVLAVGGYFGAKYYLSNNPKYVSEHPRVVSFFGVVKTKALISQTAGWNTYDNFGIEFQYPNSKAWGLPQESISENVPQITFNYASTSSGPFFVSIFDYSSIVNGPQTFDQALKNSTSNNSNSTVSDIKVGGINGKEIIRVYTNNSKTTIFFNTMLPLNDHSAIMFDGDSTFTTKEIFETLVSTFKFDSTTNVQKDSATGLNIYNNGDMTFEYPEKFNSDYFSLNLQTVLARPGNANINIRGCYEVLNGSERLSSEKTITINNVKFCMTTGSDVGAGQAYNSYYYTTLHDGYYYVIGYVVHSPNACGGYENSPDVNAPGNEKYKACIADEKNWDTIVIKPIQDSIATFKFTK